MAGDERFVSPGASSSEDRVSTVIVTYSPWVAESAEAIGVLQKWEALRVEGGRRWTFKHRDYDNGGTRLHNFELREAEGKVTLSFQSQHSSVRVSGTVGSVSGYEIQTKDGNPCLVFTGDNGEKLEVRDMGGLFAHNVRSLLIYHTGPPTVQS